MKAMICAAAMMSLASCVGAPSPPAGEAEAAGWGGVQATADPVQVAEGRRIAERACVSCHAIDRTSSSPRVGAPPLRHVLALYADDERLAVRFIDGMRVGHEEMPVFDLDIRTTDALIAYIRSITAAGADNG